MSLNSTPSGERVHIDLFGMTYVGKASIINALTNQEISIVSDVKWITTEPVYKAIEILTMGPCMIIDTEGLDDESELGELRKKKTLEVLAKTNVALVVIDSTIGVTENDTAITKEHELRETLENLKKKPKLVITDSQVFLKASADTPKDIMLTSFSILQEEACKRC